MRSLGKTALRQQGSHLGFAWMQCRGLGKRMPKTPGPRLARQTGIGRSGPRQLCGPSCRKRQAMEDVLDDFEERLNKAVSVRQTQADKGLASPEELKELAAWKQKQPTSRSREPRSSQQVQQLTAEDEKARLQVSWRLWERQQPAPPLEQTCQSAMWRLGSWTGRTPGSQCQIRCQSG